MDRRPDADEHALLVLRVQLAQLVQLRDWIQRRVDHHVASIREAGGSWQDVGDALGTTRQAAHERYKDVTP